jgi:hypothetical protein
MWPIRLLLHLVAFVLTAATFLLSAALAFDLPGLLASGRIDRRIPQDMRREMGVENWPFVLRSLGSIGLFLLACLTIVFIMWARRARGATHLLRGIAGAGLLIATPFVLAHHGVDWGIAIDPTANGWGVWQEFVQGLPSGAAVRAGMMFIGAMVLLLWPATARVGTPMEQPTSGDDPSTVMMAGAQK